MTTKPKEDIIELIRRCLALSTSSNENEAAVAAAKAQELLFKYNISIAEIGPKEDKLGVTQDGSSSVQTYFGKWRQFLAASVCKYNWCRAIVQGNNLIVIGLPYNVEAAKEIYEWLSEQIFYANLNFCKTYKGHEDITKHAFQVGFYSGATATICRRLKEQWEESSRQAVGSTALILRNDAVLEDYINEVFKSLHTSYASLKQGNFSARLAGQAAAASIPLTPVRKVEGQEMIA
jgi:hypothetical protein